MAASDERSPARIREAWLLGGLIVAVLVVALVWAYSVRHQRGDPDPGHRRVNGLRPVLTATPAGAHIESRSVTNPLWDSCDGKTPGWNDANVDVRFTSALPASAIVAHIAATLQALGWTLDPGQPTADPVYWSKSIEGSQATVQLLGGPDTSTADWDLQASVQPATHPLPCLHPTGSTSPG